MDTEINPRITEIATALAELMPQPEQNTREFQLEEALELADRQIQRMQIEDIGWQLLQGGQTLETGVGLAQLKEMSELLQPAVAGSPLPKQANNLRSSYTFSEPFIIPGIEQAGEAGDIDGAKKPGAPSNEVKAIRSLKAFIKKRTSREYVFGKSAQELISTACSTDGLYLLLGDNATKALHPIPLREITAYLENEDFPGEVWAYLREWNTGPVEKPVVKKMWYYTDRFEGKKPTSRGTGNARVEVDKNSTMFDLIVNTQVGWAFGVPDLWAGHVWNRNYLQAMKDGLEVTDLLAWLTAKVKTQSKKGSDQVGVRTKAGGPAGSVQTSGNTIDTYATTGKAYEFDALRPIAAIYALAAGVSVVDLLSSPSAAGASYGSAQALAPGMRRAIAVRRDLIAAFHERIIEWAIGDFYQVTAASIEEETPYRTMQILQLSHMTGLFHWDEIRGRMAAVAGITLKHKAPPEGYMVPNNSESLARSDVDTDGVAPTTSSATSTSTDNAGGQTATAPAANQGKSAGTGGTSSTGRNDIRQDGIK